MSIKHKIAIGLIVLSVVFFGIAINGLAYDIEDRILSDLAKQAADDPVGFMNTPVTDLVDKTIGQGAGNDQTVYYKSGICMYHRQSTIGSGGYKIVDVLDFDLNSNGLKLMRDGVEIQSNAYTGTLAKEMFDAYSEGTYKSTEYSTALKRNVTYAFSQALQNGGIQAEETFYQTSIKNENVSGKVDSEYGEQAHNYKAVQKNSQDAEVTVQHANGYTMIGPFNVTFSAKSIEKIGVYSDQKSIEAGDNGEIYYNTYFTNVNDAVAHIANASNTLSNIPSGVNFYIIVSDNGQEINNGTNLRVTIYQQAMKYYHARLILAENPRAAGQNIGIFAAEEKDYAEPITYNISEQTQPVDLKVVKYGENSVEQANVKFLLSNDTLGYAHWGNKENQNGVNVYTNITFTQSTNQETRIFETGLDGEFVIRGLDSSYTYSVQEITNPNKGYQNIDIKNATLSNGVANVSINKTNNVVTGIRLSPILENTLEIIDRKDDPEDFTIHINKVNESGKDLEDVEFKVKVLNGRKELGWLYYDIEDEKYDYDNKYSKSTTWNTSKGNSKKYTVYGPEQGIITIPGLNPEYSYEIYEVKAADGYYDLDEQIDEGMKVTIDGHGVDEIEYIEDDGEIDEAIYCGTVSYEDNDSSVTVRVTNVKYNPPSNNTGSSKKYLYISGNIWIDERQGKQEQYDDLYNSNTEDLYKQSVKVSIINSSGKTVKTTTTKTGEYNISTGISIKSSTSDETIAKKLSGYYIKFEYSDKYTPVSPNFKKENGSKAVVGAGEENIKDGIAYIYSLSEYVDSFYKYKTLEHMNLGLIKNEDTDYEIKHNIAYVKVVINGYTYTYEYGETGDVTKDASPTVQWQNSFAYTRTIYPSDIAYGNIDGNSFDVYVVYRIDVTNTNSTNTKYGKEKTTKYGYVSYVEIDLQVTSLTSKYDTDRYELEKNYDVSSNGDFDDWTASNGVATYKGNKFNKGIDSKQTETVYIQFKIKNNALNKLLNTDTTETYEKNPTIATVHAYHNYWRTFYVGEENPHLVSRYRETDKFEKTAEAYYLRLKLNTERIITGTVFEDENVYTNGEVLGDGMYGNDEKTIGNVKVELLLVDEDGKTETATKYSKSNNYIGTPAEFTTKGETSELSNGTVLPAGAYIFEGVTPGKYKVRFTYGDGTVSIADYKSTIVSDVCIQTALGYKIDGVEASVEWYKHTEACNNPTINNTATDNLTLREKLNTGDTQITSMEADTPLMSIGVENTEKNIEAVTATFEDGIQKEKIQGINFGIIKIPEISLAFDKVVSNIKITNAQGNILVDGNPATQNIKYVSNLDGIDHTMVKGSQYTKSEINEDELYGSTLELTYSITVQNNSEVNYYENVGKESEYYGYYYKFGDSGIKDVSYEVTITVDNVLDFIDPVIKYENISIDDKHKIEQVKTSDNQEITDKIQDKTDLTYSYLVDISNWNSLYTTKHLEGSDKKYSETETQDTAELTVTRLLSTDDDDLGVSNVAQVTKVHVTNTPALVETIDASEIYFNDSTYVNPTDEVYVMITPPTGADTLTTIIYVITAIVSLCVITAGVVLIKKKVLGK